jgi:putative transposase
MACLPRFVAEQSNEILILWGNNRAEIFRADPDYNYYLEKLKLACTNMNALFMLMS